MTRTEVPYVVSKLMGDRPARWAPAALLVGDYDGRERTLEVFNAEPKDQLDLRKALRPVRSAIQEAAGGPVVIIFHTEKESAKRYADFVQEFPQRLARPSLRPLSVAARIDEPAEDNKSRPHRRVA
jgi:hypothetical protein